MNYCAYADVFMGCGQTALPQPEGIAASWFFIKAQSGNTSPAAALPFGKMTAGAFSGGYPTGYGDHLINCAGQPERFEQGKKPLGFSHLCHSGTGAVGYYYNYAVVSPHAGQSVPKHGRRYEFSEEYGEPGYYSINLEGIRCELTVESARALHRYRFPADHGVLSIDFTNDGLTESHGKGCPEQSELYVIDARTAGLRGIFQGVQLYIAARCFSPCELSLWQQNGRKGVNFAVAGQEALLAVAISVRSMQKAEEQLGEAMNFDSARAAANTIWNKALSRVEIDAEEHVKRTFYSNLYHSLIKPCDWGDDGFIFDGGPFVTDFVTLWDMYKTQLPLVFLLYPETGRNIVESLIKVGETLGFLPNSLGISSDFAHESKQSRILGAYALLSAYYMGLVKDPLRLLRVIEQDIFSDGKRDFTVEHRCACHSWTLDMADGCAYAAALARELGEMAIAERLAPLGNLWASVYNTKNGLLRADSQYYEGTLYNYSFRLCAHMKQRIGLCGGNEAFVRHLDRFFGYGAPPVTQPIDPRDDKKIKAGMRLGRFEGFNNEPDMETPYSYIFAKRHDRSCEVIAAGRKYMFGDGCGGLPGNNDSGGLSSCYVWNMIGLFPVAGQDLFLIGSPGIQGARLFLSSGKVLEIKVHNFGKNAIYVQRVSFNGKELSDFQLPARTLMQGGSLAFEMSVHK